MSRENVINLVYAELTELGFAGRGRNLRAALLGHDQWKTWRSLDAEGDLVDEERTKALRPLARQLAGTTEDVMTLSDLRSAAAEGG
ncbi:hypothetical protein [Agromyces binzhouensis]|uniref:hypothetical protein n=1 Tax=Agromyces binzhouensis TaxID=1817495 RepID=UPI003632AF8C